MDADLMNAVDIVDGSAYVGVGNAFVTLDVKDPTRIEQVGQLLLSSGIESIHVAGEYAYVNGSSGNEHHLIDLTDPSQPREIRCQEGEAMPPMAKGVVRGGIAYVRDPEDGSLKIYEVRKNSIVQLASYQSFLPARLRLNPDFEIISEPRLVSDVVVVGDYVYVAENRVVADEAYFFDGRILVLDASDPRNPKGVIAYDIPQGAAVSRLFVEGDYLLASAGDQSLTLTLMLDITNPADIAAVEVIPATELLLGVADGHALFKYSGIGGDGIRVRELADIMQTHEWHDLNMWPAPTVPTVAVTDDYAYFLLGGRGMAVVDITDPLNPHLAGTFTYLPESDNE